MKYLIILIIAVISYGIILSHIQLLNEANRPKDINVHLRHKNAPTGQIEAKNSTPQVWDGIARI